MQTEKQVMTDEEVDFDPRTGEVLDVGRPGIEGEPPEQLSQIGRWLDGRYECLSHLDKPRPDCTCKDCMQGRELSHIVDRMAVLNDLQLRRKAKLNERIAQLQEWAKQIVDDLGGEPVKIPGVGKFAYLKGKEGTDTTEYDSFDDNGKVAARKAEPTWFAVKYSPDKKAIRQAAKDGKYVGDCGFAVVMGEDKFKFTRQK